MRRLMYFPFVVLLASCSANSQPVIPEPRSAPPSSVAAPQAPASLAAPGNDPVLPKSSSPSTPTKSSADAEHQLLGIYFDLTGRAQHELLGPEGEAHRLVTQARDSFFTDQHCPNRRLVITHHYNEKQWRTWEGTCAHFAAQFPDRRAFQEYLSRHAASTSQHRIAPLRETVDTLVHFHTYYPKSKSGLYVFNDMRTDWADQNHREQEGDKLGISLHNYAGKGGAVFLYGVDPAQVDVWATSLKKHGFKRYKVSTSIPTGLVPSLKD